MLKTIIRENEDLKNHTTFKIGGKARFFFEARTPELLIASLVISRELKMPCQIISGGSNVIFKDEDYPGMVIKFSHSKPEKDTLKFEKGLVIASANLPLKEIVSFSLHKGLEGLESLSGIPGNIAGAIVGNAGAYGRSIGESVEWVEIFNGKDVIRLDGKACRFSYRHSVFKLKPWVVLRAAFRLKKGNKKALLKKSQGIIEVRAKKYPPHLLCPGSFFKNVLVKDVSRASLKKIDKNKIIEGKIPAGYLLEEAGAKGMKEGSVRVADYHGNLIINDGGGTFKDLEKLVKKLKQAVKKRFGIDLEEEVRYIL